MKLSGAVFITVYERLPMMVSSDVIIILLPHQQVHLEFR